MLTKSDTEDKQKRKYTKRVKIELTPTGDKTNLETKFVEFGHNPRDEFGFLKGVKYPLKPNGLVDWRKLISKEHFTLNKMNLAFRGISTDSLSKADFQKLIEESPEEDLIIKLAGFREVAELRGIDRLDPIHYSSNQESVTMGVKITWIWNSECGPKHEYTEGPTFGAIANASINNTDNVFSKFLETIAENRAFIRCVRHSLGILSLGQDELKLDDVKVEAQNTKIQTLLQQKMDEVGLTLELLKDFMKNQGFEWNDKWVSVEKIDPAFIMSAIPLIKNFKTEEQVSK